MATSTASLLTLVIATVVPMAAIAASPSPAALNTPATPTAPPGTRTNLHPAQRSAPASADIAWVWDHHAPPMQAGDWAVTVTQLQLTADSLTERPRLRGLPPTGARRITPVVHVDPVPVPRGRAPDAEALTRPLNDAQQAAITQRVLEAGTRSTSGWVQLDFEAKPSQRDSYHALLRRLRAALPPDLRLSVTLLAWQCRSAAWIDPIAADEVVPMFFRLGRDSARWIAELERGATALHPRCRGEAAGFAPQTTPPADWQRRWPRRYWFNLAPGRATGWPRDAEAQLWPAAADRPAAVVSQDRSDPLLAAFVTRPADRPVQPVARAADRAPSVVTPRTSRAAPLVP